MSEEPIKNGRTDHDILIELCIKLDRTLSDVKELGMSIIAITAELRSSKLDKEVFNKWDGEFRRDYQKDISAIKDPLIKDISEIKISLSKMTNDHEARLRRLERWTWTAIGALGLLQIILASAK